MIPFGERVDSRFSEYRAVGKIYRRNYFFYAVYGAYTEHQRHESSNPFRGSYYDRTNTDYVAIECIYIDRVEDGLPIIDRKSESERNAARISINFDREYFLPVTDPGNWDETFARYVTTLLVSPGAGSTLVPADAVCAHEDRGPEPGSNPRVTFGTRWVLGQGATLLEL